LYVWIEFLRQNKLGVTDRTGDRTGRKRQDEQQETGQTARDRTDSKGQDRKVRLSKMPSRTTM